MTTIEKDPSEVFNYQTMSNSIEEKGFYLLPAGHIVDIEIVSGRPIETPITDGNNKPTGKMAKTYDGGRENFPNTELVYETMCGDISFYSPVNGRVGLSVTSPALIEAQKKLDEWLNGLAKKYSISDEYIDKEHEEQFSGHVDRTLYNRDHPDTASEIQEKEKTLTGERDRLQKEVNKDFLKKTGLSIPEGKKLLNVLIYVNAK